MSEAQVVGLMSVGLFARRPKDAVASVAMPEAMKVMLGSFSVRLFARCPVDAAAS